MEVRRGRIRRSVGNREGSVKEGAKRRQRLRNTPLSPTNSFGKPIKIELQCSKRCQKLHNHSNISKENGNQTARKAKDEESPTVRNSDRWVRK
ncbi:hypothetical protein CCACVL1_08151 [Corchorus capsularis]|uniref:Uncharacterized protein n=1 Tax=Corchorus capsularis TaxID=210143 RepID=A0A1R3J215_COCAP|nr:hypothetical protein CCACVL1_08151 [Corchorus capsularis]